MKIKTILLVLVILLNAFILTSSPQPVRAAGNATLGFNCDALWVSGTTDQYAISARVIVRWSGFPGTTRAGGTFVIPGSGSRPFKIFVPITPRLTNPPPAPIGPLDPNNMEQFIAVQGLNSSLVATQNYILASATCSGTATVGCIFTDGRINCRAEDAAQTAAIYCTGDGGVTIWSVNANSVGKFAFTATAAEIAKVPANPDKNTLIKQALNIALYRLHGGKMQVNAPHDYVFIWDGC